MKEEGVFAGSARISRAIGHWNAIMLAAIALLLVSAGFVPPADAADCSEAPTFSSIRCRLAAFSVQVNGPDDLGPLETKLRQQVAKAQEREGQAEGRCEEPNLEGTKTRLDQAIEKMAQIVKTLRSREAKKSMPEGTRNTLLGEAEKIRADLQTLRGSLQCPVNPAAICGDGVLDREAGEQCEAFEGPPDAPLSNAFVDVDLETGAPESEFDVDPEFGPLLRTRLEIEFAPDATVGDGNRVLEGASAQIVMMLENVSFVVVRIPDPGDLAALTNVVTAIEADPAVRSVRRGVLDAFHELPPNFSAPGPNDPDGSEPALETIDNHLAVRAAAAWNAREAIATASKPTVVVVDGFGDGQPNDAVSATYPVPADFETQNINPAGHGYHIIGTLLGSFGGTRHCDSNTLGDSATGDATGRDCVTGMMPSSVPVRVVDVQKGVTGAQYLPRAVRQDRLITLLKNLTGPVVVNESMGFGTSITGDELNDEAVAWIQKVRGGLVSNATVGAGLENRFLHVLSAGNTPNALAQTQSPANAAALLPNLEQVAPIPNLTNVLAVENVINTPTPPFAVACLSAGSSNGGHVAGIGTEVWSLIGSNGGVANQSGSSTSAPQVSGLAAYVWSLAPTLTPQQVAGLLQATALRPVAGGQPVAGQCGDAIAAPTIDAYEAVLSVDAAALPTATNAPVRKAILDVDGDRDFDEDDLAEFVANLIDGESDTPREQDQPDYGRFDLNGDGFTGRPAGFIVTDPEVIRFDLDREGSQQFGAPSFGPDLITQSLEDVAVPFDETNVSDLAILCYYAYSAVYTGDAEERRSLLDPATLCFILSIDAEFPETVENEDPLPLSVEVSVLGENDAEASAPGMVVELTARGAASSPESGTTDDDGVFESTITPTGNEGTIEVDIAVRAVEDGPILAQETVTSTCPASNVTGHWTGNYGGGSSGTWSTDFIQSGETLGGTITIDDANLGHTESGLQGTMTCRRIIFGSIGIADVTFDGFVTGTCANGSWRGTSPSGNPLSGTWSGCKVSES